MPRQKLPPPPFSIRKEPTILKNLLPYLWLPGSILLGVALSLVICLLTFGSTALLLPQVVLVSMALAALVFLGFVGAQISELRSFNKGINERIARKSLSP